MLQCIPIRHERCILFVYEVVDGVLFRAIFCDNKYQGECFRDPSAGFFGV